MISIDAKNRSLGRVAAEAAFYLQDKNLPSYAPNKEGENQVSIQNASSIKFTGKKVYYHYTGYPGGLRKTSFEDLWGKDPKKAVRMAVWGMLPKNRLRPRRLRRLKIEL